MDNADASTKPPYACMVKSVKDFAEDMHGSAGTKHTNVAVIGCTWSNDDLNCKQAEAELFEMLQRRYNFSTESYTIDARAISPEQNAQDAFLDFRKKHQSKATPEDAVVENVPGSTRTAGQIYSEICRDVMRSQLAVRGLDCRANKKRKRSVVLGKNAPAASVDAQELRDGSFRVLVQVHLGGEGLPNPALIEQWRLWLSTNLPTMGDKIEVEAMYKTTSSTVLHVSMPAGVWDGPAD
ncbi:hypothetical protein SLS58_005251 [Diplodia intermedia]|uniref:THUMP domain-containing protein n=1 Tax=Diplodia intermedia TaxID=856260 RepID=A0ABR3TRU5_9PEZI